VAQSQGLGDLPVSQTLAHQLKHVCFPRGEPHPRWHFSRPGRLRQRFGPQGGAAVALAPGQFPEGPHQGGFLTAKVALQQHRVEERLDRPELRGQFALAHDHEHPQSRHLLEGGLHARHNAAILQPVGDDQQLGLVQPHAGHGLRFGGHGRPQQLGSRLQLAHQKQALPAAHRDHHTRGPSGTHQPAKRFPMKAAKAERPVGQVHRRGAGWANGTLDSTNTRRGLVPGPSNDARLAGAGRSIGIEYFLKYTHILPPSAEAVSITPLKGGLERGQDNNSRRLP
jgi:hypothetical protein